jgi:hypothetical protein
MDRVDFIALHYKKDLQYTLSHDQNAERWLRPLLVTEVSRLLKQTAAGAGAKPSIVPTPILLHASSAPQPSAAASASASASAPSASAAASASATASASASSSASASAATSIAASFTQTLHTLEGKLQALQRSATAGCAAREQNIKRLTDELGWANADLSAFKAQAETDALSLRKAIADCLVGSLGRGCVVMCCGVVLQAKVGLFCCVVLS